MVEINRIKKTAGIIGNSDAIQQVLEMVVQVGPVDISVLITGESGTGKEMVAKAIHSVSRRSNNPLLIVNCGAIPVGIIESELFGHKKGAYTGATEDRKGYFETVDKGTIFLDEIGETPLETQVKLLRVLDSGEFIRVGDSETLHTDVRVIAATNQDLGELVRRGNFRQDLFYRLKTVSINIPLLRDRVEDIGLLVERFALEFTRSNDIAYKGFVPEAVKLMKQYGWPGNVRELKNFVESILVVEKGERITYEMVERHLSPNVGISHTNPNLPVLINQSPEAAERELILRQIFLVRQDVESIKNMLGEASLRSVGEELRYLPNTGDILDQPLKIDELSHLIIKSEALGSMTLDELNKEAIERTLKYFNNNRRAAAQSLGMSERTLYRKISEYGLERKIKRNNE